MVGLSAVFGGDAPKARLPIQEAAKQFAQARAFKKRSSSPSVSKDVSDVEGDLDERRGV